MTRPRVLFVSRERIRLPLAGAQERKWRAVETVVEPRVLAVANQPDSGGWKLAGNLTRMNFKPPLQNALAPRSITYLGYAPAEVRDPAERAQVDALSHTFALDTGSFDWKGRVYRYAVAHQLSCVSPPAHRD